MGREGWGVVGIDEFVCQADEKGEYAETGLIGSLVGVIFKRLYSRFPEGAR